MSSVKNFMSYLKKLFAFLKVFKLLSMCPVLYPKQYRMGEFTSVGIGLIELTEPPDTLNYKPLIKHCILQTILHVLLLYLYFIFFDLVWGWHSML